MEDQRPTGPMEELRLTFVVGLNREIPPAQWSYLVELQTILTLSISFALAGSDMRFSNVTLSWVVFGVTFVLCILFWCLRSTAGEYRSLKIGLLCLISYGSGVCMEGLCCFKDKEGVMKYVLFFALFIMAVTTLITANRPNHVGPFLEAPILSTGFIFLLVGVRDMEAVDIATLGAVVILCTAFYGNSCHMAADRCFKKNDKDITFQLSGILTGTLMFSFIVITLFFPTQTGNGVVNWPKRNLFKL